MNNRVALEPRRDARALIAVMVWSLGLAATADAQLLSTAPAPTLTLPAGSMFNPPATSTLTPRVTSMFAAGQIVDRPTGDLRPRFHWGLLGSVIPTWTTPGGMGTFFFDEVTSAKMSGRDLRIGVVRARPLGFEMGVSYVRKTVSSFTVVRWFPPDLQSASITSYRPLDDLHMTGVDAHLVIPIARFGERVQLGILAAGGIAWIPDSPIQKRIDGPPFYADANSTVALSSPPAAGGFVREWQFGEPVPLVPGTTHGVVPVSALEMSPTDYVWPLLRGQLAADFLLARPLKLRLAAGFHYPGTQALGVDVVYLFRTGRLDAARVQPGTPPAGTPGAQVADQPQVIAPRRSYWGVLGGAAPFWFTPHWSEFFRNLTPEAPFTMKGQDFRIGLTNGRPLGKEFGISFVRKSWTEFSFVREGRGAFVSSPGSALGVEPLAARITLSQIEPVQIPGLEFHSFVPIDKIGSRVQLGGLFGFGAARVPDAAIQKRIEGPPYVATATILDGVPILPAAGGFVLDEDGEAFPVAPGQTGATVTTGATEISPLGSFLILARAQIAADVLIAAPFKLRFSAGFNYPGAQLFGIEAVYMFGTGR
jgi:hypothetical protein